MCAEANDKLYERLEFEKRIMTAVAKKKINGDVINALKQNNRKILVLQLHEYTIITTKCIRKEVLHHVRRLHAYEEEYFFAPMFL